MTCRALMEFAIRPSSITGHFSKSRWAWQPARLTFASSPGTPSGRPQHPYKPGSISSTADDQLVYQDPATKLQQFLQVPLFGENEKAFQPSRSDIERALQLFRPSYAHQIKFLKSCVAFDGLPQTAFPEVVFIGRSNVGKSSLLQAILKDVPRLKVKTSRTPGLTKFLNYFQIGNSMYLVDAPGYGWHQPKDFVSLVEAYLRQRKSLMRTFLLIDCKVGFTQLDHVALDMLEEFKVPYCLILTKADSASASRQLVNLMEVRKIRDKYSSPACFFQPFLVSAVTGEGVGHVVAFIAHVTGNHLID